MRNISSMIMQILFVIHPQLVNDILGEQICWVVVSAKVHVPKGTQDR